MRSIRGRLDPAALARVVSHIEDNLGSKLSLADIAAVAEMSVSHLQALWFSDTYVRTAQGWRYAFGQASLALAAESGVAMQALQPAVAIPL